MYFLCVELESNLHWKLLISVPNDLDTYLGLFWPFFQLLFLCLSNRMLKPSKQSILSGLEILCFYLIFAICVQTFMLLIKNASNIGHMPYSCILLSFMMKSIGEHLNYLIYSKFPLGLYQNTFMTVFTNDP